MEANSFFEKYPLRKDFLMVETLASIHRGIKSYRDWIEEGIEKLEKPEAIHFYELLKKFFEKTSRKGIEGWCDQICALLKLGTPLELSITDERYRLFGLNHVIGLTLLPLLKNDKSVDFDLVSIKTGVLYSIPVKDLLEQEEKMLQWHHEAQESFDQLSEMEQEKVDGLLKEIDRALTPIYKNITMEEYRNKISQISDILGMNNPLDYVISKRFGGISGMKDVMLGTIFLNMSNAKHLNK